MEKASGHFVLLAIWFFGTWFLLSRIDFLEDFGIREMTKANERKLAELFVDAIKKSHDEIESDSVKAFISGIKDRICEANGIADSSVTLHIIVQDDVNAYALPDRHLVINTGLIRYCKTPEELAGVIAHEIAHMEHHHVEKKLAKEVGLSMMMTIVHGEAGGEIMREAAKMLSSTAFDREQESEADRSAVQYLAKAGIDPEELATFLFRLSGEKFDIPKRFELLSTHPNSSDRAAEIEKLRKNEEIHPRPIGTRGEWNLVQLESEAGAKEE